MCKAVVIIDSTHSRGERPSWWDLLLIKHGHPNCYSCLLFASLLTAAFSLGPGIQNVSLRLKSTHCPSRKSIKPGLRSISISAGIPQQAVQVQVQSYALGILGHPVIRGPSRRLWYYMFSRQRTQSTLETLSSLWRMDLEGKALIMSLSFSRLAPWKLGYWTFATFISVTQPD